MEIMHLSAQEVILLNTFAKLAEEAFRAEKLINEHFNRSFGITQKEIPVYHSESCGEYYGDGYLTVDGIFKYHDNWWGGRKYQFRCDAEGIYKMLRSCYLKRNQLSKLDPEPFDCQIEYLDGYFREFIESLEKSDKKN